MQVEFLSSFTKDLDKILLKSAKRQILKKN